MGNPLFNDFNTGDRFADIIQEAQNFKSKFKGNPKEEVQKLLNSGQMSQAQFNQLMPIAQRIAAMISKGK